MKSPLLPLAGCFALGILLARPEHRGVPGGPLWVAAMSGAAAACLLLGLVVLLLHQKYTDAHGARSSEHSRPAEADLSPLAARAGAGSHSARAELTARQGPWLTICGLLALAGFVFAGAAASYIFELRFPPNHVRHLGLLGKDPRSSLRVEGYLVSNPRRTASGLQFDLEATSIAAPAPSEREEVSAGAFRAAARPVSGKIRLEVNASGDFPGLEALRLHYGDSVRALVRLRRPRTYLNPGSFDFRTWMESIEDIYWLATVSHPSLVEELADAKVKSISAYAGRVRGRLSLAIDRLYPPWTLQVRNGAVLKAALLGDRSAIDSDTVESFRRVGLYHLLVIAGLHVGLLALLAEMLLRALRFRETWRCILVLVFLWGYSLLVEQRAPTLRATLMISTYLLARLFYRERAALNAIGFAALVLLVYRPSWLFESGFQLSFSAALVIVGLVGPILQRTTEQYRNALWELHEVDLDPALAPRQAQFRLDLRMLVSTLGRRCGFLERHPAVATAIVTTPVRGLLWTVNILLFSALLQLGLLLPMAETFHRVTYAGIGLNALAIPVMTALLAIAVPVVILAAVAPALAVWPAKVLALVLHLLFVLTGLPHLPAWLSYRTPGPPNWVAYSFAVSMVAAACTLGRARKAFKLSLAAVACFVLLVSLYPFAPGLPRGVLELAALDCGGGSVLFVVLPDRTTMLFDAGVARGSRLSESEGLFERQRWDRGEDIISPYLWSRGLKKVDVLVLATGHDEQSLSAVMENFRVGELWYAHTSSTMPASDPSALYRLHGEAHQRGALLREMAAGDSFSRGGALIQILWPPAPAERPVLRASDESPLAMRISTAGGSVLLPGGITGNEEQELVLTSSAVALKSKVLAVGRSGAKLASTPPFLARVRPELAIVSGESLGAASRPSPETLERLQAVGASVLRTDLVGTVTIQMRSGSFSVHCFARPCGN